MTLFFFSLSIILILALPLAAAVWLRRRYVVAWWLFCVGMATFIASQLLHFPLNDWLSDAGLLSTTPEAGSTLLWALTLGFTAALSETLARVVGYFFLFRWRKAEHPQEATMVGLGHGGIEAIGLVAVLAGAQMAALWALQNVDLATLGIPTAQLAALETQMEVLAAPWLSLVAVVERLIAMTLHVILSLLVWYAFHKRSIWPIFAALLYHMLFDAVAAYLPQQVEGVWLIEGALFLMLLPGLSWAMRLWRRAPAAPTRVAQPVRTEMSLFGVALRKELRQQWRSYRLIVVVAVFLLFGLGSPLMARFTPELLGSLEGAEMLADLIPEPSTADALGQYIKNITQFGFIIALLLGMGAVAGEKERGTAAMVLSKPLPRWAFILSKFTAQALVYAIAFAVSALGAYYYTEVLFEGLSAGPFIWGNFLLLLWMLIFAAFTLLSSTLAPSTAAAAGIALVGAVVLLLAGSIPVIGPVAPSGLVAWASQLGLEATVMPSGGALVAGIALIISFLIVAVAVIEVQEQ